MFRSLTWYSKSFEVDEYDEERPGSYGGVDAAEMPPWFQAFFARYVRQREELKSAIATVAQAASAVALPSAPPPPTEVMYRETTDEPEMDAATFKKMSLNITLLEGGILFHSIFVGMTISITNDGFLILLIAILFHQFFEGLGLGSRIADIPYPKRAIRPWVLVCAFGLTCPIGQVIGLVTRGAYDPASAFALILVGVFNAISSGLLIFAATVDLLAEDFLSDEAQHLMTKGMKIKAFIFVLLGGELSPYSLIKTTLIVCSCRNVCRWSFRLKSLCPCRDLTKPTTQETRNNHTYTYTHGLGASNAH